MPAMQTMLTQLNQRFGHEGIHDVELGLFSSDSRLSDALHRLELADEGLTRYLDLLPPAIHASLLAVLHSAVERAMPVTFAWAPGYDYELSVWDVANTDDTAGGITVLLKSRYPGDQHPLASSP